MNNHPDVHEIAGYYRYDINHLPVGLELGESALRIVWDDGRRSEYHYLWLRDNCPCHECISELSREQVFEICDVPLTIRPETATLTEDGRLDIVWDHEAHKSRYHPGWLRKHCYSDEAREERVLKPVIWEKGQIDRSLPTYGFADIMEDDGVLLNWLRGQRDYGLCLVEGVPTLPGTVQAIANRISFIRETNFGVLFDVQSKPDANSAAYTTLRLPLHTDLPTRELQPGLQFLHCLVNDASGGESILVDGFRIAEEMREHYPEDFAALSTLPMDFYNKDRDTDYRFRATALKLDSEGNVSEVRIANFLRGPLDLPGGDIAALYKAYRQFMLLTRESRFQYFRQLQAGDMIVFDNRRVLHARNAFDLKAGDRHLQGCYVDRDELLSRIRVLERTYG
ncbi:gamma-butyrobetaine dioxygenase [Marinobacterium jannaschii]|uniref:gamma-butyrobetaine dioxygenase n=1 Tax=Marinobacterium jannaschii TaxID=64970 RepID=UPI0004841F25|nr:gamma-butyrobetaine dioxygenase [Marinobacterium jannaschii]